MSCFITLSSFYHDLITCLHSAMTFVFNLPVINNDLILLNVKYFHCKYGLIRSKLIAEWLYESYFSPTLWGDAAVNLLEVQKHMGPSLMRATQLKQVLEHIDQGTMEKSILQFPLRRSLNV